MPRSTGKSAQSSTTYIALLRGINVGGRNMVGMADLRALLAEMGFTDGQSLLQSGNLVFRGRTASDASIERKFEDAAAAKLELDITCIVRTSDEWRTIIAGNPFAGAARDDPTHLVAVILKAAPTPAAVRALQAAMRGPEEARVAGSHAYITYPNGQGRSPVTNSVIERALGTRATARNGNTVLKLGTLAAPD